MLRQVLNCEGHFSLINIIRSNSTTIRRVTLIPGHFHFIITKDQIQFLNYYYKRLSKDHYKRSDSIFNSWIIQCHNVDIVSFFINFVNYFCELSFLSFFSASLNAHISQTWSRLLCGQQTSHFLFLCLLISVLVINISLFLYFLFLLRWWYWARNFTVSTKNIRSSKSTDWMGSGWCNACQG